MRKLTLITVAMLLLTSVTYAQKQENIWYFGWGAGLDFTSGVPVPLTNGALSTDEGCATICNSNGELLFYTNGEVIYNRNHKAMNNGSGLQGHFSSTQSCVIVPMPGHNNLFYVFTVAAEAGNSGQANAGLSYSIVDITRNAGLGEVTTKNINLINPATEKLTAVRHRNGKDVWIIVHKWNSDEYFCYLLTCEGVKLPVVNKIGRSHVADLSANWGSASATLGCIKASPDGSRLASIWTQINTMSNGNLFSTGLLDIFSFNNGTGVMSTPVNISYGTTVKCHIQAYGVAFSPDNSRLYTSHYSSAGIGGYTQFLYQYDLTSANIAGSEKLISNEGIKAFGTMQLAPDGKIYIARTNGSAFLSCISKPNTLGIGCDYQYEGVLLNDKLSTWGLPNNWDNYNTNPKQELLSFKDTLACGSFVVLNPLVEYPASLVNFRWSDGSTAPSLKVTTPGNYWLEVITPCDTLRDTVKVTFREDCRFSVFVPNTFTPNDDGLNDVFFVVGSATEDYHFEMNIYDRWGQQLFSSSEITRGWDGKIYAKGTIAPIGVYVWKAVFQNIYSKEIKTFMGHVSIIR